jgi:isopentenyldiphosphate isomerase
MTDSELVDIVDDQDNPTGQQLGREEVHAKGLPHRVSAVLVFRENGNLIIQVHKYHGRRKDHSVGGHVSAGETYEIAAQREMEEELNLKQPLTKVANGVFSHEYYPATGDKNIHVFGVFTTVVSNDWQLQETEEVDQIIEMKLEDIVKDMNANPDEYLQGFFTTLAVYLRFISSDLEITAYGKEWGRL